MLQKISALGSLFFCGPIKNLPSCSGLEMTAAINMAASETEEVDVAKEFNLLPIIFETIQALQKTNDPQEFTKKVNGFRAKLQHCRALLDKIPGIEMSCEEQKELLIKCKTQYTEKCELLKNYRNLPVFAEAFVKETK